MKTFDCIDAGSEYCPCHLAELGECIVCTVLQGKGYCSCSWPGACIYLEFLWNNSKAVTDRKTILAEVVETTEIKENLYFKKIKVSKEMARRLTKPGSYVFMRGFSQQSFFDAPIAIIHADEMEGLVTVAININGPKTKLLERSSDRVYLRGPYWNGLLGHKYIEGVRNSKCLVVLGGVSQASGALVINRLINNGNEVTLFINKSDVVFIKEYISTKTEIHVEHILSDKGRELIKKLVSDRSISCVYSGGSDAQHDFLFGLIKAHNPGARLAVSNNNRFCCGEGICGSCETLISGRRVRTCKVQFDPKKHIRGSAIINPQDRKASAVVRPSNKLIVWAET